MLKGINPRNPQQARVFFDMNIALDELGERVSPNSIRMEPPWRIVELLGKCHGFRKIGWIGQPIVDGIDIWIEYDGAYPAGLPGYLRDVPWKPVDSP